MVSTLEVEMGIEGVEVPDMVIQFVLEGMDELRASNRPALLRDLIAYAHDISRKPAPEILAFVKSQAWTDAGGGLDDDIALIILHWAKINGHR